MRADRQRGGRPYGAVCAAVIAIGVLLAVGAAASAGLRPASDKVLLVGGGTSPMIDASAPGPRPMPSAAVDAAGSFLIAGSIAGLYPGDKAPMELTVSNPETFEITVLSISTVVSDASTRCHAAKVRVRSFSGALKVAAKKSAVVTVRVRLVRSAPDACQGAKFPFHYVGLAMKT